MLFNVFEVRMPPYLPTVGRLGAAVVAAVVPAPSPAVEPRSLVAFRGWLCEGTTVM